MALLSLDEATSLMCSYGIKCDVPQVKKWLIEGKIKGTIQDEKYFVAEDEVHT